MKKLLVSYNRAMRVSYIARSFSKAIEKLSTEKWDILYISHDLAKFKRSGYDVMEFLKENPHYAPKIIICISSNPSKKSRINGIIEDMYGRIFDQRDIDVLEQTEKAEETP